MDDRQTKFIADLTNLKKFIDYVMSAGTQFHQVYATRDIAKAMQQLFPQTLNSQLPPLFVKGMQEIQNFNQILAPLSTQLDNFIKLAQKSDQDVTTVQPQPAQQPVK